MENANLKALVNVIIFLWMPWNHWQGIFQVGHADSTRIDWFGAIQDDQPVVDDGRFATERWGDVISELGDTRGGCLRLTDGDM
jgi:hypothetical protein